MPVPASPPPPSAGGLGGALLAGELLGGALLGGALDGGLVDGEADGRREVGAELGRSVGPFGRTGCTVCAADGTGTTGASFPPLGVTSAVASGPGFFT